MDEEDGKGTRTSKDRNDWHLGWLVWLIELRRLWLCKEVCGPEL